ncbi:hypothetical protein ACLOJK_040999 [Asimina triloba]
MALLSINRGIIPSSVDGKSSSAASRSLPPVFARTCLPIAVHVAAVHRLQSSWVLQKPISSQICIRHQQEAAPSTHPSLASPGVAADRPRPVVARLASSTSGTSAALPAPAPSDSVVSFNSIDDPFALGQIQRASRNPSICRSAAATSDQRSRPHSLSSSASRSAAAPRRQPFASEISHSPAILKPISDTAARRPPVALRQPQPASCRQSPTAACHRQSLQP